ncbi:helix-turn-helix domain-containing protein [Streptomyces xanthochromogenes]|uniref:helix-turn-helix domain-containing protein n=1 Tax=Streptomyces xanthochromogenes TaxID=67384 RepID=UPI00382D8B13
MDQDWAALGEALKAAREACRPRVRQEDVAAALNISRATVQNIERGQEFKKVSSTIRAYARFLGWTPESPEQVLAGGEPTPADETPAPQRSASRTDDAGLPMAVQDELDRDGALVDTAVIPLGDGTNMVVIVKGGSKNPSPEERQRHLEAWRRAQAHLKELDSPIGDPANGQ